MRIVSYALGDKTRFGIRVGDDVADAGDDLNRALADGSAAITAAGVHRLADLRLVPVVPRPGKIICLGLNYRDHARESGLPVPAHPVVFLRATTSMLAAGAPLPAPVQSEQLDYEGELAVVIGRGGRGIPADCALDHVAGYTIFNDITVRDYQMRGPQWTIGKNFDGTGVLGPELVTADELPPGCDGLRIVTRINGRVVQDGSTADMIFKVAETIASLSETMTLEPGDVIATGTPAGVGGARKPQLWLKPGDICEVEIEGIGVLSTPIVAPERSAAAA